MSDLYTDSPNVAPSFLKSIEIQKTSNYLKDSPPTTVSSVILFDIDHNAIGGDFRFIEMSLNEGMLNSFIYGHLDVRNSDDWIGKLNFTGTERIIIKFGFGDSDIISEFICTIYSVKIINNFVDNSTKKVNQPSGVSERTISYRMEFISEDAFNTVFDKSLLYGDKDFVGYIATSGRGEIPGLVNKIAETLKVNIDIEPTRNSVWLKSNEISFPSGVPKGQIRISQLMQYLCKYAVSPNNTNAVNYFFWKDRSGYHFKSIEKILKDSGGKVAATFNLNTDDETDINKVRGIEVINQYDSLDFLNNNVYSSHYVRTRPNYDDPYMDFLSSVAGFTYDVIDYDYHRDWGNIKHIEQYKLLSKTISTSPIHENKKPKPFTREGDEVFGYYDLTAHNEVNSDDHTKRYSVDSGFGSGSNSGNRSWWDYLSRDVVVGGHIIHHDSRTTNNTWQPQFDMTELEIAPLYTIIKKIREPLLDKRREFVRLKNIKRRWEAYRCVVCCLDGGGNGGTEDIKLKNEFLNIDTLLGSAGLLMNTLGLTPFFAEMFGTITTARDIIFGPTGPFGDMNQEYRLVAAGSFTDVVNYDPKAPGNIRGLTYSYDLTKQPYNQTIGEFYNIKPELPNYVKYVIERGLHQYTLAIEDSQKVVDDLDDFISKCPIWIDQLDSLDNSFEWGECTSKRKYFDITEFEYRPRGGYTPNYKRYTVPIDAYRNPETGKQSVSMETYVAGGSTEGTGNTVNLSGKSCVMNYTFNPFLKKIDDVHCADGCGPAELPNPNLGGGGFGFGGGGSQQGGGNEASEAWYECFKTSCYEDPQEMKNHVQIENPLYVPLPGFIKECSNHPSGMIRANLRAFLETEAGVLDQDGTAYFNDYSSGTRYGKPVKDYNFPVAGDLSDTNGLYIWGGYYYANGYSNDTGVDGDTEYTIDPRSIIKEKSKCLKNGDCWITGCASQLNIEFSKRVAIHKRNSIALRLALIKEIKTKLETNYIAKWKELYDEWWNRKAFFYSKVPTPGEITSNTPNENGQLKKKITSPLSLYNVSSIKRKPIRGSRYEILAKSIGIETEQIGEWAYNIFFGNAESLEVPDDISREVIGYTYDAIDFPGSSDRNPDRVFPFHPYYDQGYSIKNGLGSFITQRSAYYVYAYSDNFPINNPPWQSAYMDNNTYDEAAFTETGYYLFPSGQVDDMSAMRKQRLLEYDMSTLPGYSNSGYIETFNIFQDDLTNKKPPNIKREEIASYVRIEFETPIGLDRLAEFPTGFIRDAGSEYFLPYIVSLTPGPNGRQSIRNNIAVIGLDPYGFDVAIKKMNVEDHTASKKYSWYEEQDRTLNETSMDLWPEFGFETERPYYTAAPNDDKQYSGDISTGAKIGGGAGFVNNAYYGAFTNTFTRNTNTNKKATLYNTIYDYDKHNTSVKSAGVDPEYKSTANGSGYLLASHKKIKPHRSWWSFEFPKNIYIPQKITGLWATLGLNGNIWNDDEVHNQFGYNYDFGINGEYPVNVLSVFGDPPSDGSGMIAYGYHDCYWWYGSELDQWLSLADTPTTRALLAQANSANPNTTVPFLAKTGDHLIETMNVHSDLPEIEGLFSDTTNHWMTGDHIMYRPGLITTDVWKYDLSGETEYGLVHPPTSNSNYDIFDQNFAAQFVVHGRSSGGNASCSEHYTCANPNGTVSKIGCPDSDPYCNCPAQDMIPDEREPTYLELYALYTQLKECDLIKDNLGEEYLGCVWSDPNNPCSCNCPEIGDKFKKYLEYSRTYATFWETPRNTPLLRNSQMEQLFSQKIAILVPTTSKVKVGDIVELIQPNPVSEEFFTKQKNLYGKWLVLQINHTFTKNVTQGLNLTLCRDSLPMSPDATY